MWKLSRIHQDNDGEEYLLSEREMSVGRGYDNNIVLLSLAISRRHCIFFREDNGNLSVKDVGSSNGTFIGCNKIKSNENIALKEDDVIGIGWMEEITNVIESDKFIFRLQKVKLTNDLKEEIEQDKTINNECNAPNFMKKSDQKSKLKRFHTKTEKSIENRCKEDVSVIDLLSDSDSDCSVEDAVVRHTKKVKLDSPTRACVDKIIIDRDENNFMCNFEYEAFNCKQEYLKNNGPSPIQIDSESEVESDNERWALRLSQSSHDEPLMRKSLNSHAYQNLDEEFCYDLRSPSLHEEDEISNDLIQLNHIQRSPTSSKEEDNINDIYDNEIWKLQNKNAPVGVSVDEDRVDSGEINAFVKKNAISKKSTNQHKKKSTRLIGKSKKEKSQFTISNSQKEKRRKKLKDIATKSKSTTASNRPIDISNTSNTNKREVGIKVSNSNRGAFLINESSTAKPKIVKTVESIPNSDNSTKSATNKKLAEHNQNNKPSKNDGPKITIAHKKENATDNRTKKNITNKRVTFLDQKPETRYIECRKEHTVKIHKYPVEMYFLKKILIWNTHWLQEQLHQINNQPPPILGQNRNSTALLHSFESHKQYVQVVGESILMEIWECISQAYMRQQNVDMLQVRLESVPPTKSVEIFTISVTAITPKMETHHIPRTGELILLTFKSEEITHTKFFYVQNVRFIPSPSNNTHSYYSILLQGISNKIKSVRPGEVMFCKRLTYIKNEITLFEAMDCLGTSPLCDIILRPKPDYFWTYHVNPEVKPRSGWMTSLNGSQQKAVEYVIGAVLSDKPGIQMIQGPPGTGKSTVICSMILSFFYDINGKKQQNRGKIMICASSNAAVDQLVARLLEIRSNIPENQRFRMVRVGRADAMDPEARNISSETLAQREHKARAARHARLSSHAPAATLDNEAIQDELLFLEAKLNMWRANLLEAKSSNRLEVCKEKTTFYENKMTQLQNVETSREQFLKERQLVDKRASEEEHLLSTELRIIEGADIIATTLSSIANYKLAKLKNRIALCVVDEAGQCTEPETLTPLMLGVTQLTLVGDPHQLPGYICSQRAKKLGLGESLFSRFSSYMIHWQVKPIVQLDVQYRMHPEIAEYPNKTFYNHKIHNAYIHRANLSVPPYSVVAIKSSNSGRGTSYANETEAWGVARLALAISAETRARRLTLAIITPYNGQREQIQKCLRSLQGPNDPVLEVNTVDRFQGQERDVVVASLARSSGVGFLADAGRANVLLTRARHALLLCLNPDAVTTNYQWRGILEDARNRRVFRSLPPYVCQPSSTTQDILRFLNN